MNSHVQSVTCAHAEPLCIFECEHGQLLVFARVNVFINLLCIHSSALNIQSFPPGIFSDVSESTALLPALVMLTITIIVHTEHRALFSGGVNDESSAEFYFDAQGSFCLTKGHIL